MAKQHFSPNQNHQQAIELREQGLSIKALSHYEQALGEYIEADSHEGIIRVLLEKNITYQHAWQTSQKPVYLELAAVTLELVEHYSTTHADQVSSELQVLVLFHVAQLTHIVGEPLEAVSIYQEALELHKTHDAHYANILSHLAKSEWYADQTETAQQHFKEALEILRQDTTLDEYTRTVWLSGALLRQAEVVGNENVSQALQIIAEVKELLTYEAYPLRWKQMKTLKDELRRID